MKIKADPVPAAKQRAESRVNVVFAANAQNIAHYNKRQTALAVLGGGEASPEFAEAARIEGMSVADYAALIASKPDEMMQAENRRRSIVVAIRAATSVEEVADLLAANGLTQANSGEALPIV